MSTTSTVGVGDLITALPIPKHVTAVRGAVQ